MQTDLQPMNAAELMDRVFVVFKNSFTMQVAYTAIIAFISIILMMFLVFVFLMLVVAAGFASMSNGTWIIGFVIAVCALFLPLYMTWIATIEAGHILLSRQAFCGQKVNLPIGHLPKIFLRILSVSIAQIILAIPFIVVCGFCVVFLLGLDVISSYDAFSMLSLLSTPGWVLLIVAVTFGYIVYSNIYALSIPVAVFEKRPFFSAIIKSWHLIKGEFWKIFGLRVLWVIVVYVIINSAQGVWALVDAIFSLSPVFTIIGSLIGTFIGFVITFLTWPLNGIFSAVLYFNQRIKREGMDIEIAIERLRG